MPVKNTAFTSESCNCTKHNLSSNKDTISTQARPLCTNPRTLVQLVPSTSCPTLGRNSSVALTNLDSHVALTIIDLPLMFDLPPLQQQQQQRQPTANGPGQGHKPAEERTRRKGRDSAQNNRRLGNDSRRFHTDH